VKPDLEAIRLRWKGTRLANGVARSDIVCNQRRVSGFGSMATTRPEEPTVRAAFSEYVRAHLNAHTAFPMMSRNTPPYLTPSDELEAKIALPSRVPIVIEQSLHGFQLTTL
jgi:hypothetical protein